ncbi:hypothetical protein [Paenibacillus camelliae]|uniref:hypothetical protein n=1 Tax=Paenibacillus camelliae TaxID=512410 RepID=UPI002040A92B|nr:hypothetical protein [Paenibacillus camelliae]MCM3632821.1 hypothetical protein [Paenibacillus camelliae]
MKKLLLTFRFWFALISILIIVQNMLGWDDKNLLLYFTTPPLLFANEWFNINWSFSGDNMLLFAYVCNFVTWYIAGLLLDLLLYRLVARKRNIYRNFK